MWWYSHRFVKKTYVNIESAYCLGAFTILGLTLRPLSLCYEK
jgi:hypothetical protein